MNYKHKNNIKKNCEGFNICNTKFKILGIPDEYMINGSQADVLDHYDMSPEKISDISKSLLNQ